MGKIKKVADLLAGAAEKLGGTTAERMARAAEQGFDTSRVLYHGSRSDIAGFDPDLLGASTQAESAKKAFFFTDSPENASEYAGRISVPLTESRLKANGLRKAWTELEDSVQKKLIDSNYSDEVWESVQPDRAVVDSMRREERALMDSYLDEIDVGEGSTRSVAHGQSVYPVHLKMDNPYEYDFQGGDRVESFAALLDKAKEGGHDSAIFRNVRDPLHNNVHVVFEPNQIRSVNADFNPANADSPNLLASLALPVAAGLAGTAALAPQDAEAGVITKGGKRILEAWHGSPHSFDKFDISKIGTGEGAQAYGHGLYFADAQGTAKQYRDDLTPKGMIEYKGEKIGRNELSAINAGGRPSAENIALRQLHDSGGDIEAAREILLSQTKDPNWARTYSAAANALDDVAANAVIPKGSLYRTHIDVDPDSLLDYDAPLSEQPEAARNALANMRAKAMKSFQQIDPEGNPTAGQIMHLYSEHRGGNKVAASEELMSQGIPGLRYRDQMSRGDAAEPTFNYVMFDDKPISIVERGNATPALLGATAVGTGGTMAAMSPESEQYNRDAAEAHSAAQSFSQRRAGKSDYWKQKRDELVGLVDRFSGAGFKAMDMPLQGYMGLSAVAGGLASGQGIQGALQQGGRVAAQPTDVTAYQYGQSVTDQLTPYLPPQAAAAAGALVNAGSLLGSPL